MEDKAKSSGWARQSGEFQAAIEFADRVLAVNNCSAWAWRERAICNLELQRPEEALRDASSAVGFDRSVLSHAIRAEVLVKLNRIPEAQRDFRDGLRLCVNSPGAILGWLATCANGDEKRAVLRMVMKELARQTAIEDGAQVFFEQGLYLLSADEMDQSLRYLHSKWPSSLRLLSLLAKSLVQSARPQDAVDVLTSNQSKFEATAFYWTELGSALLAQSSPDAESVLSNARQAAFNAPGWESAWDYLRQMGDRFHVPGVCEDVARQLVAAHPANIHAMLRLADVLDPEIHWDERLKIADHVLAIAPDCAAAFKIQAANLAHREEPKSATHLRQHP